MNEKVLARNMIGIVIAFLISMGVVSILVVMFTDAPAITLQSQQWECTQTRRIPQHDVSMAANMPILQTKDVDTCVRYELRDP